MIRRAQATVDGSPALASIFGAKGAGGRNGHKEAARVLMVKKNGMHGHAARAGLPNAAFDPPQAGQFLPGASAVLRFKDGGVFHSRVSRVGIMQRGLDVPDALELPRMLRAVVPFMRSGFALIGEFVAFALGESVRTLQVFRAATGSVPCFPAVIGTLDDLAKPAAGLRSVDAVRIGRRTFEVIDFPAGKMGAADSQSWRAPSAVKMKAPFLVPANRRILLIPLIYFGWIALSSPLRGGGLLRFVPARTNAMNLPCLASARSIGSSYSRPFLRSHFSIHRWAAVVPPDNWRRWRCRALRPGRPGRRSW